MTADQAVTFPCPVTRLNKMYPSKGGHRYLRDSFHVWRVAAEGTRVAFCIYCMQSGRPDDVRRAVAAKEAKLAASRAEQWKAQKEG